MNFVILKKKGDVNGILKRDLDPVMIVAKGGKVKLVFNMGCERHSQSNTTLSGLSGHSKFYSRLITSYSHTLKKEVRSD
jgi:hypothetical protein